LKPLIGYRADIMRQIDKFPFESNVFLMMRFRKTSKRLSDFIITTLSEAGLNGVRADHAEWNITNNVYNPIACIYCCKYGIALFDEAEPDQVYNPNVIYELGMMHSLHRECLILKNDSLPPVPFDLIKDLYMPYKGQLAVRTNVQKWLQRITPESAEKPPPPRSRSTPLELAAVAATKGAEDAVVSSPDKIASSALSWRISSRKPKAWNVSWSIRLTNNGTSPTSVVAQVLFIDQNGFALEDHIAEIPAIPPGKTVVHKSTAIMSPDLAQRITHALAKVSAVRK
jgi:hypothetical protein